MRIKKKKVILKINGKSARFNLSKHQISFLKDKFNVNDIEELDDSIIKLLKSKLMVLTDTRQKKKKKYKIWDIVTCVILASFSSVESWYEINDFIVLHYDWLKVFLKMSGGIPTRQTIERIMSLIDNRELESILTNFFITITSLNSNEKDIINLDGRIDKSSARNKTFYNDKANPLNSLNAYSNNYGICLASEMIDEKTNEIPTVKEILKRFSIKDVIVTWDALNTQTENVKEVISMNGDYVVPIKGNQGNFFEDLKLYFDDKKLETIIAGNTKSAYLKINEKSHSSIITYEYFQTNDVSWYFDKDKWAGLKTIGLVKKTIERDKESTTELRYYISSLYLDIELFSKAIRNHWSVENKLHWHLDFTFREDDNTTANKNALFNLQLVNKFCLGVLNKVKPFYNNISLQRIRKIMMASYEEEFINLILYLSLS